MTTNANTTPATAEFMKELVALMEKHQLVVVPTYEHTISAHDPLCVIPLDDFWRDYYRTRAYTLPPNELIENKYRI